MENIKNDTPVQDESVQDNVTAQYSSPLQAEDKILDFIKGLLKVDIDLIDSDKFIAEFEGTEITLNSEDVNNICILFANIFERETKKGMFPLTQQQFIRMKIMNLVQAKLREADNGMLSVREIAVLSRMFKSYEIDYTKAPVPFKLLAKICREIKPGISEDNILYNVERQVDLLRIEKEDGLWYVDEEF